MAVFSISVINTSAMATITNSHSVLLMPKKKPAAITEQAAKRCIQELCCVVKKSFSPLKAYLKLLALASSEKDLLSLFFTCQK